MGRGATRCPVRLTDGMLAPYGRVSLLSPPRVRNVPPTKTISAAASTTSRCSASTRPRASRISCRRSVNAFVPSTRITMAGAGIARRSNSSSALGRRSRDRIARRTSRNAPHESPHRPHLACRAHPPLTTSCPGGLPPRSEHGQSGVRTLRSRRQPLLLPTPPSERRNDKRRRPARKSGARPRRRSTSPNGRFTPTSRCHGRYRSRGFRATSSPSTTNPRTTRPSTGQHHPRPVGEMARAARGRSGSRGGGPKTWSAGSGYEAIEGRRSPSNLKTALISRAEWSEKHEGRRS